jgi:gliding motility-associated-like protein
MKRFLLAVITVIILSIPSFAAHIKGGFFTYEYLGPGTGTNLRYRITLTVYMICNPNTGQVNDPINFSIFNAGNNQFIQDVSVSLTNRYDLGKAADEPCITGNQSGCYYTIIVYDLPSIELASSPDGYIFSYQRCCRIAGINNIISSGSVGNTFFTTIPGTLSGFQTNSSPTFSVNDTAVVCSGSYFQYSFQATDRDGDSLSYSFCDAFQGASQGNPAPTTATSPPYSLVPYASPFSGFQPMGTGVRINPLTGLISGNAPGGLGEYVICVCVNEYRNGVFIGTSRKELHIVVSDCEPLKAVLNPKPTTCDGYSVSFQNDAPGNQVGAEYFWDFGDPASGALNTSTLASDTHTYTDTGVFTVKLRVSLAGGLCSDSATLQVKVFPGFKPGFIIDGGCYTSPYQFTDTTRTDFGFVNSWSWNFGDLSTLADTSHLQNPLWTFASPGPKDVTFIVTNSKGCVETVRKTIDVLDKPLINLAFRDTLICVPDNLTLQASGIGVFNWTPNTNIINANTATPTVNPTTTTWYVVNLFDNGCFNKDSVRVRVINNVTLRAINDTTICQGDAIQLNAVSDGLAFSWTPVANLDNPNIINPIATTNTTTTYTVVATVGSCRSTDQVVVTTVPYPIANAGNDPTICYNTSAQLNASMVGSSFTWSPVSYLNNPSVLNPLSTPPRTTQYILSVFDVLGCPKPGRDTITVIVNPRVRANAGRDTIVVVNQPLQLNGSGGVNYLWSPATGLNNTTISNPIGVYGSNIDTVRYKLIVTDAIGCADSAYVTVRVYKTNPSIFVPTAFTPNGDGLNDKIYPISVGMEKINYFRIYNRWGEMVFSTVADRDGWNGSISGTPQGTGVYVWVVSAIDYTGRPFFQKGTVTLIR